MTRSVGRFHLVEGAPAFRSHLPQEPFFAYRISVKSRGLDQAYRMQDFAFETSMAIREKLYQDGRVLAPDKDTASMIGTLGKVWKDAQEQIRIHKGKPLPGSLTHEKVKRVRAGNKGLSAIASMVDAHLDTSKPVVPPEATSQEPDNIGSGDGAS